MCYEERRDAYLAHLQSCVACVSSFTGPRKAFLCNEGWHLKARFSTVSLLCAQAVALLNRIV